MKLGNEYLVQVKPKDYERAKSFIENFLSDEILVSNKEYFVVKLEGGERFGISSEENAPTEKEYEFGTWLSLETDNFSKVILKLKEAGLREVKGGDSVAFFFNMPGGCVFKLKNTKR